MIVKSANDMIAVFNLYLFHICNIYIGYLKSWVEIVSYLCFVQTRHGSGNLIPRKTNSVSTSS